MFKKLDFLFWMYIQPIIIRKVKKIIVISEDVAKDIMKIYSIDKKEISVIHCSTQFDKLVPNNPILIKEVRKKYNLPENYTLFLGIIALEENLHTLN